MTDVKAVAKFEKLSRTHQELVIADRNSTADTMRLNLASDVVNGRYGLHSVVRQMMEIEDYEETTRRMRMVMKEV